MQRRYFASCSILAASLTAAVAKYGNTIDRPLFLGDRFTDSASFSPFTNLDDRTGLDRRPS